MLLDFAGNAENQESNSCRSNTNAEVSGIRIDGEVANQRTTLKNMC